jgi:hypothetical protein
MQTKIKNPYEDLTEGNVPDGGKAAAFEQGVQAALAATKPRRFADEQPEEGQGIICINKDYDINCFAFYSLLMTEKNVYFNSYTHWLPYPELD